MKTLEQLEKEMADAKVALNKHIMAENTRRHASLVNLLTKHCGVRDDEFYIGRAHVVIRLESSRFYSTVRVYTSDYQNYNVASAIDVCDTPRKEFESEAARVYDLIDKLIEFNDNPQVELSFTLN